MAARVAKIGLNAGRRLSRIVFYAESDAGRHASIPGPPRASTIRPQCAGRCRNPDCGASSARGRSVGSRCPARCRRPFSSWRSTPDPVRPSRVWRLSGREEEFARGLRALLDAWQTDRSMSASRAARLFSTPPASANASASSRAADGIPGGWPASRSIAITRPRPASRSGTFMPRTSPASAPFLKPGWCPRRG